MFLLNWISNAYFPLRLFKCLDYTCIDYELQGEKMVHGAEYEVWGAVRGAEYIDTL